MADRVVVTASCFLHGDFTPELARCPICARERVTRERDQALEALRNGIQFVRTGGPLHTTDRQELVQILRRGFPA